MTTFSRRQALIGAAATVAAAKGLFPSGAYAAGQGPEVSGAKLGFIALTDASPLIIAKEKGLFAKYGLPNVEVLKQASWGATRDNIVLGSQGGGIDGAHILSPMPYQFTLGVGARKTPMYILSRLNTNGQGISVGNDLKNVQVGLNAAGAKAKFAQMKAAGNLAKVAMTYRGGTHDLWVRYWLAAAGINPDTDVSTIVIPPPQMVANMKAGTQDVFCVGEPWNGQLVNQKIGYTATTSSEIWMNHPEKALGMRADWVDKYPNAAKALIAAVMEAQQWCDKNRPAMCAITAGRQYINVPINDILPRLQGKINYGDGRNVSGSAHLMKFWADNAGFPFKSHDTWFVTENKRWGIIDNDVDTKALVNKVNRSDLWREVAKQYGIPAPADSRGVERFFDGKTFDWTNPNAYLASQPVKKLA
ncbi:CmpA/NrtA family ABC transporter substrate-binding protein [Asticcacaulis excentricus]|uniref:Nitrate binding protein NrtA n=1 Tax=Asticcacaulis excentricus (strain ATCC 15261 / DSM 4724 / KCTC 12464 / NCIMB 9791 / VKM B-1370 / CB 48) TaxID=573065 RepID=E8RNL5_ASTEC|nr:CmpA/NrtA family ABC transporter substrate-binding protein [Asticcacaulis excentricus]ADU12911.1 nitrate binding protein NrtA [Asticcacaulis excentricus CB 48]